MDLRHAHPDPTPENGVRVRVGDHLSFLDDEELLVVEL